MGMLRLFLPHCQRSKEGFDLETASVSSFQMGFVAFTSSRCNIWLIPTVIVTVYAYFRCGL